jgi:hypothetical protein
MDGWNKIFGWETMWKEACWFRWRILIARDELQQHQQQSPAQAARQARHLLEENQDRIGKIFGSRVWDGKNMLLAMFDERVRALCPHTQVVQREAYRPVQDERGAAFGLTLECTRAAKIVRLFSTMGVEPRHYEILCDMQEEDVQDLMKKSPKDSAFCRFVANFVAEPGIKDAVTFRQELSAPLYTEIMPDFWKCAKQEDEGGSFGELFYETLLSTYPELLDYFAKADMDSLGLHIMLAIDLVANYPSMAGQPESTFRKVTDHLAELHQELGVPTDAYPKIGMTGNTRTLCRKIRNIEQQGSALYCRRH